MKPTALLAACSLVVLTLVASAVAQQQPAPASPPAAPPVTSPPAQPLATPRIVGTMSELMVDVIYPTSDAVLYISTRTPANEAEWNRLEGQTLMLAEAANLLMMPGRARDQGQWMQDAKLMLDAGAASYKAAKARDLPALEALNDQVYASCTTCH